MPLKLPIITNPINRNSIFKVIEKKSEHYRDSYNEKALEVLCVRAETVPSRPGAEHHHMEGSSAMHLSARDELFRIGRTCLALGCRKSLQRSRTHCCPRRCVSPGSNLVCLLGRVLGRLDRAFCFSLRLVSTKPMAEITIETIMIRPKRASPIMMKI